MTIEVEDRRPRCQALLEDPPSETLSPEDWLVRLFSGERCGKPADRSTIFGPRCEQCFERLEVATAEGKNLLGILAGNQKDED